MNICSNHAAGPVAAAGARGPVARRPLLATAAVAGLLLAFGAPAKAAPAITVETTIAQIAQPLQVIAGDRATVDSIMGEGVDPHLYRPTRSDIARLTAADVVLYNGLSLEGQMGDTLERLSGTKPVVAVGDAVPEDRRLAGDEYAFDPHVWMNVSLWQQALQAGIDAMVEADPEGAETYRANAADYFAEMEAVGAYADGVLGTIPEDARVVVTAHDAFGYFGDRFGLEVVGIQGISTESEAGLRKIEEIVDLLVERNVGAVFVETTVADRNIQALIDGAAARGHTVAIGGELFSDAMGAPGTYEGTYIGMLDHNATTVARALGGTAPERGMAGRLGEGS